MGSWIELVRLGGTVVALGLIASIVAVSLIFEAPLQGVRQRVADGQEADRRRAST